MKTYLANLWDWLRTSFWFVPLICVICSVVAAIVLPIIDNAFNTEILPGVRTTATAARSTLSAIAGALMAITGTVFSITIVTLSLTSQQFGPRLLRTFINDFHTQFAMGTFLGTGLYCLLVLRVVERESDGMFVPHLSVSVAVLLTVLSMGTLIHFIHRIAVLIQAPHVVETVAKELCASIARLYPQELQQSQDEEALEPERDTTSNLENVSSIIEDLGEQSATITARREGYVQAVDEQRLIALAVHHDLVLQVVHGPGSFVSRRSILIRAWCQHGVEELGNRTATQLADTFIVGTRRTPRQDVECAIEELSEVAVRSLSPGINDPFTTTNCIDWLCASMEEFAQRRIPAPTRCDVDGNLRLIFPAVGFAEALDKAFHPIRHYGREHPSVLLRLLESYAQLAQCVVRRQDTEAIRNHSDRLLRVAKNCYQENCDVQAIEKIHDAIVKSLARTPESPVS